MRQYHPFRRREHSFKYIYCFGLGVMSMGHMKSITETQDYFSDLLDAIELSEDDRQQIFIDMNNRFEKWIDKVFAAIRSKEEQYCFTLDLYSILKRTSWAKEYCSQVLEDYLQVFQFSAVERAFFDGFYHAAQQGDEQRTVKLYRNFQLEGYHIGYEVLKWFDPDFYVEDHFGQIRVPAGKTCLLDHPVRIDGNIEVDKGGSLLIKGAKLLMSGNIFVRGGRIQIENSQIEVSGSEESFWMVLKDTAFVTISETSIDCRNLCGVLQQNSGRLLVEESELRRTSGERSIDFSGKNIVLRHSRFQHARVGILKLSDRVSALIENCIFSDSMAEYGGAIYSNTLHRVRIISCSFRECHAKYLGAAVYFKNQKLGQEIADCQCMDCTPEEELFFNELS